MNTLAKSIKQDPFSVFNDIAPAMLVTDQKKKILFANNKLLQLCKVSLASIVGKTCGQLLHPDQEECSDCKSQDYKQLSLNIGGEQLNTLLTSSVVDGQWEVKIIQDISKILVSLSDLSAEVEELRRIINETFPSDSTRTICCECHKLRMPDGSWDDGHNMNRLKISRNLSHGLCPLCANKALETLESFRNFQIDKKSKS